MLGWLRKFGDRVVFQTPPHEPAMRTPHDPARLIAIYDQAVAWNAEAGDWDTVDRLLDERNRIRPPQPAHDRWEARARRYGDNPW